MSSYPIPPILHQTWRSKIIHGEWQKQFDVMRRKNPHITFKLYDDSECERFIEDNFDDIVLWAYKSLNTGAYKADLWRYCVLYIEGGIYMDIKMVADNLDNLRKYDPLIIKDKPQPAQIISWGIGHCESQNSEWKPELHFGVWQAVIAARPKNPIFEKLIYNCVKRVIESDYGPCNALHPTGPAMVYKTLHDMNLTKIFHYSPCQVQFVSKNNTEIYNRNDLACPQRAIVSDGDVTIAQEIDYYREYATTGLANPNKLSNLHYTESWLRCCAYKYSAISMKNLVEVVRNTLSKELSFCDLSDSKCLSVRVVDNCNISEEILLFSNKLQYVTYKITDETGRLFTLPFKSTGKRSKGMFNITNIGNNTISWHAFGGGGEHITIISSSEDLFNNRQWKIIPGHCSLFYYKDDLYSVMRWWPVLVIAKVDLANCIDTNVYLQPKLDHYLQSLSVNDFTKNICFSHQVVISDTEVLFLVGRQSSSFDAQRNTRITISHQFIRFDLHNRTFMYSKPFTFANNFYERCCGMELKAADTIEIKYKIFPRGQGKTFKGDICFNDIPWFSDINIHKL